MSTTKAPPVFSARRLATLSWPPRLIRSNSPAHVTPVPFKTGTDCNGCGSTVHCHDGERASGGKLARQGRAKREQRSPGCRASLLCHDADHSPAFTPIPSHSMIPSQTLADAHTQHVSPRGPPVRSGLAPALVPGVSWSTAID